MSKKYFVYKFLFIFLFSSLPFGSILARPCDAALQSDDVGFVKGERKKYENLFTKSNPKDESFPVIVNCYYLLGLREVDLAIFNNTDYESSLILGKKIFFMDPSNADIFTRLLIVYSLLDKKEQLKKFFNSYYKGLSHENNNKIFLGLISKIIFTYEVYGKGSNFGVDEKMCNEFFGDDKEYYKHKCIKMVSSKRINLPSDLLNEYSHLIKTWESKK